MPRTTRLAIELNPVQRSRFWSKVSGMSQPDGCWLWSGSVDGFGYGRFATRDNRTLKAHRVAWTLKRGPIPSDLTLDHLCRMPACVNPAHFQLVTNKENILRGESFAAKNAVKTHCPQGHALTPDNLVKGGESSNGRRVCLKCAVAKSAARRARPRRNDGSA